MKRDDILVAAGIALVDMADDDLGARNRAFNDWQDATMAIQVAKRRGRHCAALLAVIGRRFLWKDGYAVFTNEEAARHMGGVRVRKVVAAMAELVEDGTVIISKVYRQSRSGNPVPERRIFLSLPLDVAMGGQALLSPHEGAEREETCSTPTGGSDAFSPHGGDAVLPPRGGRYNLTFEAGAPRRAPAVKSKGSSSNSQVEGDVLIEADHESDDGRARCAPITSVASDLSDQPSAAALNAGPGAAERAHPASEAELQDLEDGPTDDEAELDLIPASAADEEPHPAAFEKLGRDVTLADLDRWAADEQQAHLRVEAHRRLVDGLQIDPDALDEAITDLLDGLLHGEASAAAWIASRAAAVTPPEDHAGHVDAWGRVEQAVRLIVAVEGGEDAHRAADAVDRLRELALPLIANREAKAQAHMEEVDGR